MAKWFSDKELQERIDCFGTFQIEDEICLGRCGINIQCALLSKTESCDEGFCDEMIFPLPRLDPD